MKPWREMKKALYVDDPDSMYDYIHPVYDKLTHDASDSDSTEEEDVIV